MLSLAHLNNKIKCYIKILKTCAKQLKVHIINKFIALWETHTIHSSDHINIKISVT